MVLSSIAETKNAFAGKVILQIAEFNAGSVCNLAHGKIVIAGINEQFMSGVENIVNSIFAFVCKRHSWPCIRASQDNLFNRC